MIVTKGCKPESTLFRFGWKCRIQSAPATPLALSGYIYTWEVPRKLTADCTSEGPPSAAFWPSNAKSGCPNELNRARSLTNLPGVWEERTKLLHDSLRVIPSAAGATATPGSRAQSKVIAVLPSYSEGPNLSHLFARIHAWMGNARVCYEVVS